LYKGRENAKKEEKETWEKAEEAKSHRYHAENDAESGGRRAQKVFSIAERNVCVQGKRN